MDLEYSFIERMMHRFFSTKSLLPFIGWYGLANLLVIIAGLTFMDIGSYWLENFLHFENGQPFPKNVGTLIGVQSAVLGVISIALALVTIIAPKNNETSIIEIYYHESRAFEIVTSSFALLAVLCIEIFLPVQSIAYWFGLNTKVPLLSFIPFFWLLFNLVGINHFIMTTLDFVNPVEKRRIRKRFTRDLVQSGKLPDLKLLGSEPYPLRILKELAEKAISKIDQNDLGGFRIVWEEMIDYHRFLFLLMVDQERNGDSIAFATDKLSYTGRKFHVEWSMQYNQLFERAADKVPLENEFIRILAETPENLLYNSDTAKFPKEIIYDALDLIPALMRCVVQWASKRPNLNKSYDESLHLIAPVEAEVYKETVLSVAERWKRLVIKSKFALNRIDYEDTQSNVDEWKICQESWRFLWRYLCNTASILALGVSRNDHIVADQFQKSLLQWKTNVPYHLNKMPRRLRFLPPDVMNGNWVDAENKWQSLSQNFSVEPEDVLKVILYESYEDVLFTMSTLLLYWQMKEGRSSGIGCNVLNSLLNRLLYTHNPHGCDLSVHILRFIMDGFEEYIDDLYQIMWEYNYNNEYHPEHVHIHDDLDPFEQIIESLAVIVAGKAALRKHDIVDYKKILGKENSHVIQSFIGILKNIRNRLEDSPRIFSGLFAIRNEDDLAHSDDEIRLRVDKIRLLIDEIMIELERHS